MRKRLGRRERMLAKALAMRNDVITRRNAGFIAELVKEAKELQSMRVSIAYDPLKVAMKTRALKSAHSLIHNAVGSEPRKAPESKPSKPRPTFRYSKRAKGKILTEKKYNA